MWRKVLTVGAVAAGGAFLLGGQPSSANDDLIPPNPVLQGIAEAIGPCNTPLDGQAGVYVSVCWDGRFSDTHTPGAVAGLNHNGWPCVRVYNGVEFHADACVSALDPIQDP